MMNNQQNTPKPPKQPSPKVWVYRILALLLAVLLIGGDSILGGNWSGFLLAGDSDAPVSSEVEVVEAQQTEEETQAPAEEPATELVENEPVVEEPVAEQPEVIEPATEEPAEEEVTAEPVETTAVTEAPEATAQSEEATEQPQTSQQLIAAQIKEKGMAYAFTGGAELYQNASLSEKSLLGQIGAGFVLATQYTEQGDDTPATLAVVVQTENDGQIRGYIDAGSAEYVPYADAVAEMTPEDAPADYAPEFYFQDAGWPLAAVHFEEVEKEEQPATEAPQVEEAVFVATDAPEGTAPAAYTLIQGENASYYSYINEEGQTAYCIHGELDGVAGFYACDEFGVLLLPALRVDAVEEDQQAIVQFVDYDDPTQPLTTIALGDDVDASLTVADLDLPQTLTVRLDDETVQELPVEWMLAVDVPAQAAAGEEQEADLGEIGQSTIASVLASSDVTQLEAIPVWDEAEYPLSDEVEAPYVVFEFSPLADGAEFGTIVITSNDLTETQTEYNLYEETTASFEVRYRPPTTGTKNTILVVRGFDYGAYFVKKPSVNSDVKNVEWVLGSTNAIAFQFYDGVTEELVVQFQMDTKSLTTVEMAQWMDNGFLFGSAPRAEVWTGNLVGQTLTGTKDGEKIFGDTGMVLANYTADENSITVSSPYKRQVPSVGSMTNSALRLTNNNTNSYRWQNTSYDQPSIRYTIPSMHKKNMPLMEFTGLKVYVPDEKLEITGLLTNSSSGSNSAWNGWTVSARKNDAGGSFYELTPVTRTFNQYAPADTMTGATMPVFQLINVLNELAYDADDLTYFNASNTELTFRIPTGNSVTPNTTYTLKHTGPEIRTLRRVSENRFTVVHHPYRKYGNVNSLVQINTSYTSSNAVALYNAYYVLGTTESTAKEYTPSITDLPITQTYEIPYELRLSSMTLGNTWDHSTSYNLGTFQNNSKFHTKVKSITYHTAKGETHQATTTDIDTLNNTVFNSSSTTATRVVSFSSANLTDNYVTKIVIEWENLYTEYHAYYNLNAPTTSAATWGGTTNDIDAYSQFAFTTTDKHEDGTSIAHGDKVQIKHTVVAPGNTSLNTGGGADYLWYQFVNYANCPTLDSARLTNHAGSGGYIYMADDKGTFSGGSITLNTANKENLYKLDNPEIVIFGQSSSWSSSYAATNLPASDALTFLTGEFTVDYRLSGWNIIYTTTKQATPQTYALGTMTSNTVVTLPFDVDDGDYLTSLKFTYNGTFDMWQGATPTTSRSITIMSNIQMRAWSKNPITGEWLTPATTTNAYQRYSVTLYASLHFDNCTCTYDHAKAAGVEYDKTDTAAAGIALAHYRSVTAYLGGNSFSPTTVEKIYQADPTGTSTMNLTLYANNQTPYGTAFYHPENLATHYAPWDIAEAVYIELTDPEFIVDLTRTSLFGIPVGDNLTASTIDTADGRRFLVLRITDGYKRTNTSNLTYQPGYVRVYYTSSYGTTSYNFGGALNIGFSTLAGTRVGLHNPLGDVYVDISEILDRYDAPTQSDDTFTKWNISGGVADTYNLSESDAGGNKLLYAASAKNYTVDVMRYTMLSAKLVPGIQGVYALEDYQVDFYPHQRQQLEALMNFVASDKENLEDFISYVSIPKKGQTVNYEDAEGNLKTATSDYDIVLTGAPTVISDSSGGNAGNITYAYTTDANPGAGSSYAFVPTTAEDWAKVTGVKVMIASLPKEAAINLKLPLEAPLKSELSEDLNDLDNAYIGGSYTYHFENSATILGGYFALGTYTYYDYYVNSPAGPGAVFFDFYDENGTYNNATYERYAKLGEVTVTLYDTNGTTVIDQTTTDASGKFILRSYKQDAGQIVKISLPTQAAGDTIVYKLTKQSTSAITSSAVDSDFDRDTMSLTLGALTAGGIQNMSAGFVALPELKIPDIEIVQGNTDTLTATMVVHSSMSKTASNVAMYAVHFEAEADATIATVTTGTKTKALGRADTNVTLETTIKGLKVGTTTATAWLVNNLGDKVEVTYNIKVKTAEVDVPAIVAWADSSNNSGRPASFQVQLYRSVNGGTPVAVGTVATVTGGATDAQWTYTFPKQAEFDDNGNKYTYSIKAAETHPNYTSDEPAGTTLTNTLKTTTFKVTKKWDIIGTGYTIPTTGVEIELYRSDNAATPIATETVSGTGAEWEYTFTGLLNSAADKTPYQYTVKEKAGTVPGYIVSSVSGGTITNTYPADQVVKVTKEWDHTGAPGAMKPTTVKVYLYDADTDTKLAETTLTGTAGAAKFEGSFSVQQKSLYGVKNFEVKEDAITQYKQVGLSTGDLTNGFVIKNAFDMPKTKVDVTKEWKGTPAGVNQPTVILALYRSDDTTSPYKTYNLPQGETSYSFSDLDQYDSTGNAYTYTVAELDVPGYDSVLSNRKFTNTYNPTKTEFVIEGAKVVLGTGAPDETFSFKLVGSGVAPMPAAAGASNELTVTAKEGAIAFGKVSFSGPGVYTYTITETAGTTEGFAYDKTTYTLTLTVGDNGGVLAVSSALTVGTEPVSAISFTNHYTIPTRDHKVTKSWSDNNDALGVRPASVKVQLERTPAGGAKADVPGGEATLTGTAWEHTFTGLPVHDNAGNVYTYSVRELDLNPNYVASYNGLAITNTIKTLDKITLEKEWKISGTGFTKESVVFELWRKSDNVADEKVKEYTITAADAETENLWKQDVTGWPQYDSKGAAFTYYAKEPNPPFATTAVANGLRVTNSYGDNAQITVKKSWIHTGAPQSMQPPFVNVDLMADGVKVDSGTLNDSNSWLYTFSVPQTLYQKTTTFSVVEDVPTQYKASYSGDASNGFVITNTFDMPKVSVDGTKEWKDVPGNVTVPAITVNLHRSDDPTIVRETTVIASGATTYKFENLDKYDDNGNPYTYTVSEVVPAGYEGTKDDLKLTNTYNPTAATLSVTGFKRLNGDDGREDKVFSFTMEADNANWPMPAGSSAGKLTVTAKEGAITFGDLSFKVPGTYTYTIKEETATEEGFAYDASTYKLTVVTVFKDGEDKLQVTHSLQKDGTPVSTIEFNNTYTVPKRDITVTKIWDDDSNALNVRPGSIKVQLERTPEGGAKADVPGALATAVTGAGDTWTHIFQNMPIHDEQGKAYTYSAREVDTSVNYDSVANGLTITNSIKTFKVVLEKEWKIIGKNFTKVPVEVELWRTYSGGTDEKVGTTYTITGNASDDLWQLEVKDLPQYAQGNQEYTYYVKEPAAPFPTTKQESGLRVTNTYAADQKIVVTKDWVYTGAPQSLRTDNVKIALLRNGVEYETATVKASESWTYTFEVPQNIYQPSATEPVVTFTVEEKSNDANYAVTYSGDVNNGFVVTNTFIMPKDTITGTKTWVGVPAGLVEVPTVTIELYRNDDPSTPINSTIIPKTENTYKFENLDRYDAAGNAYVYSTKEKEVPGFVTTQSGYDFTNTYAPNSVKFDVTGGKAVTGDSGFPSEEFTFVLTAQDSANPMPAGSTGTTKTVKRTDQGAFSFGEIAFTTPGTYVYKVTETAGSTLGYTYDANVNVLSIEVKDVNGDLTASPSYSIEGLGTTGSIGFTNTYITPKRDITVTKKWDDKTDVLGLRPAKVKIQLQRTPEGGVIENAGAVVEMQQQGTDPDANTWTYTFPQQPAHDLTGKAYTYTVKEVDPDSNYTVTASGLVVTNTIKEPEVRATKTADPAPIGSYVPVVNVGDTITYTITVENHSDRVVYDTRVMDTLPQGVTLIGSTPVASGANGATVTVGGETTLMWKLAQIPAKTGSTPGTETVTIQVRVDALTAGQKSRLMENTAYYRLAGTANEALPLIPGQPDNKADYTATGKVSHQVVTLEKTASPAASDGVTPAYVAEGTSIEYTMTLYSAAPMAGIEVRDTVPTGMTFVPGSIRSTIHANPTNSYYSGGVITWPMAAVENSSGASFSFRASVNKLTGMSATIQNTASAKVQVGPSDPTVDLTTDPSGTDPVEHTATRREVSVDKEARLMVGGVAQGMLNGSAATPVEVELGQEIQYTLKVTSVGYLPNSALRIEDTLEEGMVLVPSSTVVTPSSAAGKVSLTQTPAKANGNKAVWTISGLDANEALDITFRVTAPTTTDLASTPVYETIRVLTNTATANDTSLGGLVDANNNPVYTNPSDVMRDSNTTYHVITEPAVSAKKTATPSAANGVLVVEKDDIITYSITVKNEGDEDAANVRVMDILPKGVEYVAGSATGIVQPVELLNSKGETVLMWQIPNLPKLTGEETLTFQVKVLENSTATLIANVGYYRLPKDPSETFPGPGGTPDDPDDYFKTPDPTQHQTFTFTSSSAPAGGDSLANAKLVQEGEAVKYTMTLDAKAAIQDVKVADIVPAGMSLVPGSIQIIDANGKVTKVPDSAFDGTTINWPVTDVSGGKTQFVFTAVVDKLPDGQYAESYQNQSSVELDNGSGTTLGAQAADLWHKTNTGFSTVTKSAALVNEDGTVQPVDNGTQANPVVAVRGQQVEYVLEVNRTADAENRSGNIVVTDILPNYMTMVKNSISATVSGSNATVTTKEETTIGGKTAVRFVITGMADGETVRLAFRALIPVSMDGHDANAAEAIYVNSASLVDSKLQGMTYAQAVAGHAKGENVYAQADYDKNSNRTWHKANYPVIDVEKTSDIPAGRVYPNTDITYTIEVSNNGGVDAQNVLVRDKVPAGMTYVEGSIMSSLPGVTMEIRTIKEEAYATWIIPQLTAGQGVELSFTARIVGLEKMGLVRYENTAEYREADPTKDLEDQLDDTRSNNGYTPSNKVDGHFQSRGGTITVNKVDAATGEPLAGAEFTLRQLSAVNPEDVRDYDMNAVSDENGEAVFDDIPMGKYIVFESEAPEGYIASTIQRSVDLDGSRAERSLSIANRNAEGVLGEIDEEYLGIGSHNVGHCPR